MCHEKNCNYILLDVSVYDNGSSSKIKKEDQSNFLDAQLMIGGKIGCEIIREEFFDSKGLVVISNDSSNYTITRFKLNIIKKGADLIYFENKLLVH